MLISLRLEVLALNLLTPKIKGVKSNFIMIPSKESSPVWERPPALFWGIVDKVTRNMGLRVRQTNHSDARL